MRRGGFTLVEALVALVLSSTLMILVSGTFLVQNRHQARQALTAAVHDEVRAATELIAHELRNAMPGGILVAEPRALTVRAPGVPATVCARGGLFGLTVDVHSEGGRAGIPEGEVAGAALRSGTGWTGRALSWSLLDGGSTGSSVRCATRGADISDASDRFHRLRGLVLLVTFGTLPDPGQPLLLYRETSFRIQPSDLRPGTLGLFRQVGAGPLTEFASGIDSTAHFAYRGTGTEYQNSVPITDLGTIQAVRIALEAHRRGPAGLDGDVSFGWATNVVLPRVP